ncbi:MAG: hypothetical protein EBZ49_04500 [Proteobacteria bacterium]|nr:hypothetical protein [Pseudomonadota bacterium]
MVYVVCGIAAAAIVLGLMLFSSYGPISGTHASLSTAKVGEVYNFIYEQPAQGEPERYLAKVLSVHNLDNNSIHRLNTHSKYRRNDPNFVRTNHLVTCQMSNGSVRNFYAERTKNCRKPLFASMMFKAAMA